MPLKQNALLALAESNGTGAYTILDGNRRLATLQLLGNSNFRQEAGIPKDSEWTALAKEAKVYMFDSIPLLVYTSRRDVEHHLAYTHIPGPTPWLQSARARYMAALLAREDDPADPADRIGVNPQNPPPPHRSASRPRPSHRHQCPEEPSRRRLHLPLPSPGIRPGAPLPRTG